MIPSGQPAAFCGLYGLKPSFGRFPTLGAKAGLTGQETIRSTNGPMAPSLGAIELWSKVVVDSSPWMEADPNCLPIPWRQVEVPEKLCIGERLPPPWAFEAEAKRTARPSRSRPR